MLYPMEGEFEEPAVPLDLARAAMRPTDTDVTVMIMYGGSLWKVLEYLASLDGSPNKETAR